MCAYSLDHITPSCLGAIRIPANGTTYHYFNKAARAARLSLYDTLQTFVSNARYIPIFKEHAPATVPRHFKSVCAQIIQSGGSGRTRTTGLALIRGAL